MQDKHAISSLGNRTCSKYCSFAKSATLTFNTNKSGIGEKTPTFVQKDFTQ